jgi:large subunit ribosomal protein L25
MSELKLEADRRELTGRKVGQLRRQGLVPVVVYGNVKEPLNLQVDARLLERTLHAGGDTRLVEVTINGGGKHNVLVKNVQREPVGHRPLHADFYAVNMSEKQHVAVPLTTTGKATGMMAGLMLFRVHDAIHIEALPADIPGEIEVDLTPLTLERPITIADLPKLKGISYLDDAEEVLFNLQQTREEVVEEAATTEDGAEPEVVKKGKQTDEDED